MKNAPIKMGMTPPPIGEFIREEIFKPLNLSISKAAKIMQIRRPTLSNIVNNKSRLTPEIALRIELAFGVSMALLMQMQTTYEVAITRRTAGEINIDRYAQI